MTAIDTVTAFWDEVWNAHDPDAVDRFVVDDVLGVSGGKEISGKENLKNWIREFLDTVNDLHLDALETFQSEDGRLLAN
jgi:ketosteroid isomerase-like protein